MDRILARIRESRFVIADLTHNRGGVYYEAGFAEGLGIPVIYTCDADCLDPEAPKEKRVHFDCQHLNIENGSPEHNEFKSRLTYRLCASSVVAHSPPNHRRSPRRNSRSHDLTQNTEHMTTYVRLPIIFRRVRA